jgi:hypothetical protein
MSVNVLQALRGGIVDRSLPSSATTTFPAPCRASTALAGSRPTTRVAFEAAYGWGCFRQPRPARSSRRGFRDGPSSQAPAGDEANERRAHSSPRWTRAKPFRAAGAQQLCSTKPREPPHIRPPALVQYPATRGCVVGVVVGIPGWHASAHPAARHALACSPSPVCRRPCRRSEPCWCCRHPVGGRPRGPVDADWGAAIPRPLPKV